MTQDLLPHIGENQIHASAFDAACHTLSIGPVTAKFCASFNPPSVSVELSVLGHNVANCTLSNAHPSCKIGGSIGPFKAELDLTLDIPGKKLNYTLTICAPIVGCKTYNGVINL